MNDLAPRVEALETLVQELLTRATGDDRLLAAVQGLAAETVGLNSVLNRVDEQQQELANLNEQVQRVEEASATKEDVEAKVLESSTERKRQLRTLYLAGAGALFIAIGSVIGGAWLTDKHLQDCLIDGPTNRTEQRFCNTTFPGHSHDAQESIAAILAARTLEVRAGCERDNERVRINIQQTRGVLSLANGRKTPLTAELEKQIKDFEKLLSDCAAEYPTTGAR